MKNSSNFFEKGNTIFVFKKTFLVLLMFSFFVFPRVSQAAITNCLDEAHPVKSQIALTLCDDFGSNVCDIEIGAGTSFTHSSLLGTSITGNVCVVGDLIIDATFSFINANVNVSPGVAITMSVTGTIPGSGGWLIIDNSRFFACNGLWKGIELNNVSGLYSINQSEFEDAEVAMHGKDHSVMILSSVTFNRNIEGIFLEKTTGQFPFIWPLLNCEFKCDAPINGTTDGISFAGLHLENTFYASNYPGFNTFTNQEYGIYAEGNPTTIIADQMTFEDIQVDAIFMEEGSITLSNSTFNNPNEKGVNVSMAHQIDLTDNCSFNFDESLTEATNLAQHRIGVFIDAFALDSRVNITNCSFNASLDAEYKNVLGIHLDGNDVGSGSRINISGCDWEIFGVASECLRVTGTFPDDSETHIFNNQFVIQIPIANYPLWTPYAIRCMNGDKNNLFIYGNDFNNAGDTPGWETGISLQGSSGTGNEVSDNDFLPPAPFSSFLSAMFVQDFDNTLFCSNEVINSNRAFSFYGLNDGTELTSNTVIGSGLIRIGQNSWVDAQTHQGNSWTPLYIPGAAVYATPQANCQTPSFAQFSPFETHTTQSTSFFPPGFNEFHPVEIIPDNNDEWWSQTAGTPEGECVVMFTEDPPSHLKLKIINNQLNGIIENDDLVWQAEKSLFFQLKKNVDLYNSYSGYPSFVSSKQNQNIGKLYRVHNKVRQAFDASPSMEAEAKILLENKKELISSFYSNPSSEVPTNFQDIQEANQAAGNIAKQIFDVENELVELNSAYRENASSALVQARSFNDLIAPTSTLESNATTYNDIYLNSIIEQNGELTETQIETLQEIASQCPNVGGMAVYYARGILPASLQTEYSDDYADCYPQIEASEIVTVAQSKSDETKIVNLESLQVFPNPTSNTVSILLPEGRTGVFSLYNATGVLVNQFELSNTNTINLETFPSGTYSYIVKDSEGDLHRDILIIHPR